MTQGDLPFDLTPEVSAESRRDAFPADSCARPDCSCAVEPQIRGGDSKRYCSRECQRRHWDETHPRIIQNPDKRMTRAERILARLREGPATGLDLLKAGGGTRYGARLLELRRQGYRIETDMGGEWPTYRLEVGE